MNRGQYIVYRRPGTTARLMAARRPL
jgi:hypothetical protein